MEEEKVVETQEPVEETVATCECNCSDKCECECNEECQCSCQCEPPKTTNPFAIIGFILALTSSLTIPALVLSIIGLVNWKSYKKSGKVFAIIGIVLSAATILYVVVCLVASVIFAVSFMDVIVENVKQFLESANF